MDNNNVMIVQGARTMQVHGLKMLKCPEEGGTMKEYEDYKETK